MTLSRNIIKVLCLSFLCHSSIIAMDLQSADNTNPTSHSLSTSADIDRQLYFQYCIYFAASTGDIQSLNLALLNGADINTRYNKQQTPLHWACMKEHIEVVKYLVDKGANIHAKTQSQNTTLHQACYNGTIEIVKYLLDKGANIDAQNQWEDTPLHWACMKGHIEVVKLLLTKTPNLSLKNNRQETPLEMVERMKRDGWSLDFHTAQTIQQLL